MAILLAYNITPESPPKPTRTYPATPAPSPPRPLSPSPPLPLPPPPPPSPSSSAIPLPRGRRIVHAAPDDDDVLDAETRFNTEFNTRRAADVPDAVRAVGTKRARGRGARRVAFKKVLATTIPPPCTDLVLYGCRGGGGAGCSRRRWRRGWEGVVVLVVVLLAVGVALGRGGGAPAVRGLVGCWWGAGGGVDPVV